jgi:hypothetical protein
MALFPGNSNYLECGQFHGQNARSIRYCNAR